MGEALASATNAVAQVQNVSDRISTILNTPAPDDDAELRRLFHFVHELWEARLSRNVESRRVSNIVSLFLKYFCMNLFRKVVDAANSQSGPALRILFDDISFCRYCAISLKYRYHIFLRIPHDF